MVQLGVKETLTCSQIVAVGVDLIVVAEESIAVLTVCVGWCLW